MSDVPPADAGRIARRTTSAGRRLLQSDQTIDIAIKYASNVDQTLITISEDRLKLYVEEHFTIVEANRSWVLPLSILIALVIALTTTEKFRHILFDAPTWQAIFVICAGLSLFYFLRALMKRKPTWSVDEFITKCKHGGTR